MTDPADPYGSCRYCSIRPCRCEPGRAAKIHRDCVDLGYKYGGFWGLDSEETPEGVLRDGAVRTAKDPARAFGHGRGGGR